MTTPLITPRQRAVLERGGATGVCIRYVWTWTQDGMPVTREIKSLINKGLMRDSYYRDGVGAANLTDAGRDLICKLTGGTNGLR